MKSPLQLKENKLVCSSVLKRLIPRGAVVHCYPFFTGEMELELLRGNRFLVAHTSKYVVYEFWRCLMTSPARIAAVVEHFSPLEEGRIFYMLQRKWAEYKDPFMRSGMFFLLNYHSSTGFVSSGEFVRRPLSPTTLMRLRNFDSSNFHIEFEKDENFERALEQMDSEHYMVMNLGKYHLDILEGGISTGHEETRISHKKVRELFKNTDKKCVLVYHYHPRLLREYKSHNIMLINQNAQVVNDTSKCKEVVIANF